MKKYAIAFAGIMLVSISAIAISATTFSWSLPSQKGTLTYTNLGLVTPTIDEATIDGKYAVVGGDATTGLMMQKAAIIATGTTMTNTFAVAYGAAPVVVCTYTEDPGDVRPVYVTSVTTTNFISTHASSKNYGYIAVGSRP